jgi:hypothetical protein
MDGDKILSAAAFHRSFLAHTGITPARVDQDLLAPSAQTAFAHMLWLTGEVPGLVTDHREKAMRWVCFVQGVLWDRGLITTRVLKNVMRPANSVFDAQA